jgi:hypothetical protein
MEPGLDRLFRELEAFRRLGRRELLHLSQDEHAAITVGQRGMAASSAIAVSRSLARRSGSVSEETGWHMGVTSPDEPGSIDTNLRPLRARAHDSWRAMRVSQVEKRERFSN